ncbi:MAG: hypothetical protein ACO1NO_00380 [Burkholderiaceae bacterium]
MTAAAAMSAQAQERGWEVGAVLDAAHTSRSLALGQRDQGLALGHSDLIARGPLGRHFSAQLGAAAHQADGKLEFDMEETWVQTRSLPGGFQARAGRFSSQIGYLNEQHPHADDFVERPLLYRAFLGGHWFDDGLRLNWTAPTPLYLTLGAEVFRGRQLIEEAASSRNPGAMTFSMKVGNDIGTSHSWQLGASYLHNRREAALEEEHGEHEDEHGEEHDHAHGATFSGKRMYMLDAAWKWAPDGNNRQEQLKLIGEYARVTDPNRYADSSDYHEALSLSAVWRFAQEWEVGARTDWLKAKMPHEDHFDDARLREHALMLAWKPTHMQVLRLQFTTQAHAEGFEDRSAKTVQLQYILNFGAHSAHSF